MKSTSFRRNDLVEFLNGVYWCILQEMLDLPLEICSCEVLPLFWQLIVQPQTLPHKVGCAESSKGYLELVSLACGMCVYVASSCMGMDVSLSLCQVLHYVGCMKRQDLLSFEDWSS